MEHDFSKFFYNKYFELENRTIKLILKNNKVLEGQIVGFFKGELENEAPYFTKLHFVEGNKKPLLSSDAFGYPVGEIIHHSQIKTVYLEK